MTTVEGSFVLLCAEEDDLALVRWVKAARTRGLAPEIVTGIEHDDAPLIEALADEHCGLFVVLRSASLGTDRLRQVKALFAKHRAPTQRMFALKIDYSASRAIDRIVAELGAGARPRSEISMEISLDDLTGPQPVTPVFFAPLPTVDVAIRLADHAAQQEVTERFAFADETIPMVVAPAVKHVRAEPKRSGWRRAATWIAGVGVVAAASTAAVVAMPAKSHFESAIAVEEPRGVEAIAERTPELAPAGLDAAPDDGESIVITVDAEPRDKAVRTPKRRSHASRATKTAATPEAAPTPESTAPIEPAPPEVTPLEPAPLEPLPLEPAPLE